MNFEVTTTLLKMYLGIILLLAFSSLGNSQPNKSYLFKKVVNLTDKGLLITKHII